MAINKGEIIDNVYRNENGITFQMQSMASAYAGQTLKAKPATKLFADIVKIYHADYRCYEKLLKEARIMIEGKELTIKEQFSGWLSSNASKISVANIDRYSETIEEFAKKKHIFRNSLFENMDIAILKRLRLLLSGDKAFYFQHKNDVKFMVKYISAYIDFVAYYTTKEELQEKSIISKGSEITIGKTIEIAIDSSESESRIDNEVINSGNRGLSTVDSFDLEQNRLEKIKFILLTYFSRGYRCGDSIAADMFRSYYEQKYSDKLELDDKNLDKYIKDIGVEYNGSIYCSEIIMDSCMEQKVMNAIDKKLSQGIPMIHFESLFQEFADDFLDYNVYDADMLKAYLVFINKGNYHIEGNYIKAEKGAKIDPCIEVENLLIQTGRPMEITEVISKLSYIPESKLRSVFYSDRKIRSGGRGIIFHVDIFSISATEVKDIAIMLENLIKDKGFATSAEMIEQIRKNHPNIIENNVYFREIGIRNAVYYNLCDRFTFNNQIITDLGVELTVKELFQNYAKKRKHFTKDELHAFARSIDSQIYYDVVNDVATRVSNTNYVLNEDVIFDVAATDKMLGIYCEGDYIPIIAVDSFILFPAANYPWNSYLLESYVAKFSEQYKLMHVNYTDENTAGVIVRKTSRYDNFAAIVLDALARSDCELDKDSALEYLVEQGYITSRRWDHMEMLLLEAKNRRKRRS